MALFTAARRPSRAGWCDLPVEWLAQLEPRSTQINPAETLVPMIVAHNWSHDLSDSDTMFFCDNLGAVHTLAGGLAHAQDLQVLVSITHALLGTIRCRWWIEWPPSESNCSDGLSRQGDQDPWHRRAGLAAQPLRLPPWLRRLTGSWDQYVALLDAHYISEAH